jgi:hypothetical protein
MTEIEDDLIIKKLGFFFAIFASTMCCAFGFALFNGTYYIAIFSNDFAVVSIDSRSTDPLHPEIPPNDQYCKILPLSDDLIFFSTGMVAAKEDNQVIIDAAAAARDVYAMAPHPADLGELIDRWDILIKPSYTKMIMMHSEIAEIISRKAIVNGLFIGISRSNRMALAQAELTYTTDGHINTYLNYHEPAGNGIAIFHGGHLELIEELDRGMTKRARAKIAEMRARQATAPGVDDWADKSSMVVKAVMDWSNDPTIGGDIASIIIERGRKWRWFSRPTFCKEN